MPRKEFLGTKCGAFLRPNQAKNQIKFPVLKHEKVAGFMPVSIHAFILVPLHIRLKGGIEARRNRSGAVEIIRVKEGEMIETRIEKKGWNRRGKMESAREITQ